MVSSAGGCLDDGGAGIERDGRLAGDEDHDDQDDEQDDAHQDPGEPAHRYRLRA